MKLIKLSLFLAAIIIVSGCTSLQQNIQHGNATGRVDDNRWDYYNGSPTHYTSFNRSLVKNAIRITEENTDRFSMSSNIDKNRDTAILEFNGKAVTLYRITSKVIVDKNWHQFAKNWDTNFAKIWDEGFVTEDGKMMIAVSYTRQVVFLVFGDGDTRQQIAYYPSKYLACKKIAAVKNEQNAKVVRELLLTALVAGVQSYTSYSTSRVYTNYGNFGYAVTRDYSWAGARAGDALGTLFSGQYSEEKITQAWSSLNCY